MGHTLAVDGIGVLLVFEMASGAGVAAEETLAVLDFGGEGFGRFNVAVVGEVLSY